MTYTREQILSMPVGRELDKVVFEVVKGYDDNFGPYFPSTEKTDAWELAEHMKKTHQVLICSGQMDDGRIGWRVQFEEYDERWNLISCGMCFVFDAPEAITKAAILAMMSQEGHGNECMA